MVPGDEVEVSANLVARAFSSFKMAAKAAEVLHEWWSILSRDT